MEFAVTNGERKARNNLPPVRGWSLTSASANPHHMLLLSQPNSFLKCLPGARPLSDSWTRHGFGPRPARSKGENKALTRRTLVLAAVHPTLGGVVVLGQAAALGGV